MNAFVRRIIVYGLTTLVVFPAGALAQESRAELIIQQQAEKAKHLAPYTPNKAEAILAQFQDALVLTPQGFYPVFDSVYSGGGFTLGAGYRRFIGDQLNWNLTGLYSIKDYKLIELALHSPRPASGRLDFMFNTGWRDATRVSFRGLGIDSPEARTSYRMQQGFTGGRFSVRPRPWANLSGALSYYSFTLSDGGGSVPDTDDVFTPETAPGLGDSPDYWHSTLSAAIDTRTSPDYSRRGVLLEAAYHQYEDTLNVYSFDRFDIEAVQHVPFVRESWVLSLRGRLQSTVGDTAVVPYFLLPALGSGSSLRGYNSWRFRDRHSLLFSAEWRWIPNRMALDAAIFFDAGTVADRRDALSIGQMVGNVGIGVRFHSPVATPLRIEVARGREGFQLVFGASAAF